MLDQLLISDTPESDLACINEAFEGLGDLGLGLIFTLSCIPSPRLVSRPVGVLRTDGEIDMDKSFMAEYSGIGLAMWTLVAICNAAAVPSFTKVSWESGYRSR